MQILNLKLNNMGKYRSINVGFSFNTIIKGPNASGKTTILRAIQLLSNYKDIPMIDFIRRDFESTVEASYIEGTFKYPNETIEQKLKVILTNINNTCKISYVENGSKVYYSRLFKHPCTVKFSPETVSILSSEKNIQRSFLNYFIQNLHPDFRTYWAKYKAVLRNRNVLLRRVGNQYQIKKEITYWDSKLIEYGKIVSELISKGVQEINSSLKLIDKYLNISLNLVDMNEFVDHINFHVNQDIKIGYTKTGPHTYNYDIEYKNESLSRYGSRGQNKVAMISIISAFSECYYNKNKLWPIMLIDDLESELDKNSIDKVLLLFKQKEQQKIVTCLSDATYKELIKDIFTYELF